MKYIYILLAMVTVIVTAVAASPGSDTGDVKPAATTPYGAMPPGHPALDDIKPEIKPTHAMPPDTKLINGSGKVLEVINSPTYTYLQVTGDKGPLWLVSYKIDVTKGEMVSYSDGMEMPKFHSKSLDRTFEMVYFVKSLQPAKK